MNQPKTFSTEDLDRLGLDRFQSYLGSHGWDLRPYREGDRPGIWVYERPDAREPITFCTEADTYGDFYARFAEAISTLAAFEGKSLVRMYLALTLGI